MTAVDAAVDAAAGEADAAGIERRARVELGVALGRWRRAAGLSQQVLSRRVLYARTSVTNAESGRQLPVRAFWEVTDAAVGAGGELLAAFDHVHALVVARHTRIAAEAAGRARALPTAAHPECGGRGAAQRVREPAAGLPGAALAPLTPHASPEHLLGAELRVWRLRRGLSLAKLGRMVHVTASLLGLVEKAERTASGQLVAACDRALDTGGVLSRLLAYRDACPPAEPAPVSAAVPAGTPSLVIQIVTGGEITHDPGDSPVALLAVSGETGARVIRLADVRQRRRR